jgi:DNA-binding LacI/PurR family transcriptional regulator
MGITARLRIAKDADMPIVVQLTEQLTWLIASGLVKTDERLPPIRELADELGVHMHTVREAYHRLEAAHLVSIRTRTGTVVLPLAVDSLAGKDVDPRSFLIGVLLPGPAAIYQPFIQGIQNAAAPYGWIPLVVYTQDNPFLTQRYTHQLIAKQVDGLIVTSPGEVARFERMIQSEHLPPIVYVDAPHISQNSVSPNAEQAAYQATQHLVEHGHSRIGIITAPLDWENVEPCYLGYKRAFEEAGLRLEPDLIIEVSDFFPHSGYEGAMRLMKASERPEAVFAIADALAFGVMKACRELDLQVPGDVAMASYGDVESAAITEPELTTAHIPAYEMGSEAVKRLQTLFGGVVEVHEPFFLDCPLIIRRSCGCKPSSDHKRSE